MRYCCSSLTAPTLHVQRHPRNIHVRENTVLVAFDAAHGSRNPLGVLKHVPPPRPPADKKGLLLSAGPSFISTPLQRRTIVVPQKLLGHEKRRKMESKRLAESVDAQKARGRGRTKGTPPTSSGNLCTFSYGASLGHLSHLDVCKALEKMSLVHVHIPPREASPCSSASGSPIPSHISISNQRAGFL